MFADLHKLPINPRIMSCFGDEDFVRRLCSIDFWLKLRDLQVEHQEHHNITLLLKVIDPRLVDATLEVYITQLSKDIWQLQCRTG